MSILYAIHIYLCIIAASNRYVDLIVLRLMMSLKQSWNKCFNLSWIKGHLMLLDCILMVLSRGKRKNYLIHGSVIILLEWCCFLKPCYSFISHLVICSPCNLLLVCFLIFRMMYWDSVSRLVAPGGILVSTFELVLVQS